MSVKSILCYRRYIWLGLLPIIIFFLSSCSFSSQKIIKVDLYPIPYSIEVPAEIAQHLSIENMVSNTPNVFTKEADRAGAIAQVYINYKAKDGTEHGFAGVYYFNKADYDKANNPNEPPSYGSKVFEYDSMILAVAGPQDSIFDPNSQDGKNSMELYTLVYDPDAYSYTK